MPGQVTGMGIAAGLAADQVITCPAVPLTLDRPAAPGWPRRQLPAGAVLVPGVEHLGTGYQPGPEIDEAGPEEQLPGGGAAGADGDHDGDREHGRGDESAGGPLDRLVHRPPGPGGLAGR